MKTVVLIFLFAGFFSFPKSYSQQAVQNWPEVAQFQLTYTGSAVLLQWVAKAEPQDVYYTVERSDDGSSFKTVAVILGGMEQEGQFNYRFREKNKTAKTHYRIKQINRDGSFRIAAEHSI
jgi:hypothetical protein